ncbi:flagellin [Aliiroseovarius sp. S253]|uniref:flagellin n=1 Tax=Aliiroseovarius sp. S253 TaxID=3415133 RepID=UPI003C79D234
MSISTFGDMASTFMTHRQNTQLRQEMTRLGTELSTGRKSDLGANATGGFGAVAGLEHSLKLLSAHMQATNEARLMADTTQVALSTIQTQTQDLSNALIAARSSNNTTLLQTTAMDAEQKFASIISKLNTDAGGRSLFSGAATDQPALADADTIITELMAAIAGENTAAGVSTAIDDWFSMPGSGFETLGYLGADENYGPIRLGNGETATLPVRANDPEIRNLLSAIAKTVVLAEGALSGNLEEQKSLAEMSSNGLLTAVDQTTMLQAQVGAVEARIENASAHNAAEQQALELSYNKLTAVDPYETATRLEELYSQMEALYITTARLSKLSFTDYMR